ncbi:MAG: Gfo/Idh/MocA family oxidoreductase [Acidobacteria bacterium]|nr:Gfo/Idh/MocA family oxidoreductase [Acidobacteriota bacterium]MDA1235607.1 Gfo/Idh/MocA family oxidoreductase [Acidobacteriota bacterium]
MQRRHFLAAVSAAPLAAATRTRTGAVKVGFIGASHSHASEKISQVLASPDYELAAMWEDDPELQAKYRGKGVKLTSVQSILDDASIEAVFVETAVRDHARLGLRVVQADKHLHLEKTPATDVESFRAIQDVAAKKGLVVQIGYMWRHHPGFLRIFEAVQSGWLGQVYMVRAEMNKTLAVDRRPEWGEFRGGHMFELGPHVIDPMVRLLGRPERVTPYLKKFGQYDDNFADTTVAVFEFPDAVGVVVGTSIQPNSARYREFVVYGTEGTMTLSSIDSPTLEVDLAGASGPYPKGPHRVDLPKYERYVDDLAEFVSAVGGERPLGVTQREDLIVQEAVIAASGM